MARLVVLSALLLLLCWSRPASSCLCHVIPSFSCPPPPHCCESGQYTFDECGCCMTCAKAELQECGGPSGSKGLCSKGLACLKTCTACLTLGSKPEPCVFPFRYGGQTFDRCTGTDAEAGSVWCATEVDDKGEVIEGRWGDCNIGCPGARRECNDLRFSILIGRCINPSVPGAIPNWKGAPSYKLLEPTKELFPAPLCSSKKSKERRKYRNTCRCSEGEDAVELDKDGKLRGNCTGVSDIRSADGKLSSSVWCFLENVRDPNNPKSGCYPDTTWSARDGRFWSSDACKGLPVIEDNFKEEPRSIGSKHPLFQKAINTPFKIPGRPFKSTTTTSTTTTENPKDVPPPIEDYSYYYDDEEEEVIGSVHLPIINVREHDAILPTPLPESSSAKTTETTTSSTDPPAIPTSASTTSTTTTTTGASANVTKGSSSVSSTIVSTTTEGSLATTTSVAMEDTTEAQIDISGEIPEELLLALSRLREAEILFEPAQQFDEAVLEIEETSSNDTTLLDEVSKIVAEELLEFNELTTEEIGISTTNAPTSTTNAPASTANPSSTTNGPSSTTNAPSSTNTPSTTTNQPSSTIDHLSTTISPSPTTNAPSTSASANGISSTTETFVVTPVSLAANQTIDLGIFGSFWLQTAKSISEEVEEDRTERPQPVFNREEYEE